MTSLADRKSLLKFVTSDEVRYRGKYRRVVIEVDRDGFTAKARLEGTRQRFPFSFAGLYSHAVKISVEKERAAKQVATRKGRVNADASHCTALLQCSP